MARHPGRSGAPTARLALLACRAGRSGGRGGGVAATDAQIVLHVGDAGDLLGDVLGTPARVAARDPAAQGDLAGAHRHDDVRGVDEAVVIEPVVDVLLDARVRPLVALGPAAAMILLPPPLGVAVAEPRRDLVRGALEQAALAAAAAVAVAFPAPVVAAVATAAVGAAIVAAVAEPAAFVAGEALPRGFLADVVPGPAVAAT